MPDGNSDIPTYPRQQLDGGNNDEKRLDRGSGFVLVVVVISRAFSALGFPHIATGAGPPSAKPFWARDGCPDYLLESCAVRTHHPRNANEPQPARYPK